MGVAFEDAVERFGPDDYYIKKALEDHHADMSVRQILALIRLSGFDPLLLAQCTPSLYRFNTSGEALEIQRMVDQVDRYYHLGEALTWRSTSVRHGPHQFDRALVFFERSLELSGADTIVLFNIGLCHLQLGDAERAKEYANQIPAEDPEHEAGLKFSIAPTTPTLPTTTIPMRSPAHQQRERRGRRRQTAERPND